MRRTQGRFFWKLFFGNAALLVVVVVTCAWLILRAFDTFYARESVSQLRTHAAVIREQYGDILDRAHDAELDGLAKRFGEAADGALRVTFVAADGTVLGDSEADPQHMESHAQRAEIRAALADGYGQSTRFSHTVGQNMAYVAVRVGEAAAPRGVVRVAMPVGSIVARTHAARALFLRIAVVVLAASVALALGLARIWSGRIARVTTVARSLSKGDLSARADVAGTDEVALLAHALDRMRESLAAQLATIDGQRRTLEYLLAHLQEGIVVADARGQIVLANPAARRLLGAEAESEGEDDLAASTTQVPELPGELRELLVARSGEPSTGAVKREVAVEHPDRTATLFAQATDIVLPNLPGQETAGGSGAGRLLVLTDITELSRTIQMKTDFVANASHELRTPLSAIRAAVETLSTLDLATSSVEAQPLLRIIDRHSDRLSALVADLLDLSRIEGSARRYQPAALSLGEVVAELYERFADRLAAKKLHWSADIAPDAEQVVANRDLFTLIADNLVDNAIKFTDEGGHVSIAARAAGDEVCISVSDDGCGIAPHEQDRVFERFYQVERARSGAQRGTGLGLAIVRHAVHALRGRVVMDSALGRGTRIDVFLPRAGA